MTSGLINYTETDGYLERLTSDLTGTMTLDEIIALANDPSIPAPSKRGEYYYCNTNYIILGKLIETLTGRSIGDELQARVFTPLGMSGTGYATNAALPEPTARGYGYAGGEEEDAVAPVSTAGATIFDAPPDAEGLIDLTEVSDSTAGPAGAAWSTVTDLAVWLPALYDGATLSAALRQERLTFVPFDSTNPAAGGYGLGVTDFGGLIGHDGEFFGAACIAVRDPDSGLTLIAIANLFPPKGDQSSAQEIVTAIFDTLNA
jgi:D-alanyl-D-alanine carboxypeptidase